jgi:Uma2 family endonuclease
VAANDGGVAAIVTSVRPEVSASEVRATKLGHERVMPPPIPLIAAAGLTSATDGCANLAPKPGPCYAAGMEAAVRIPAIMTVSEFLAWDAPAGSGWQLVDGEPRAMAPASRTHNLIQGELNRLIGNHLIDRGGPCFVIPNPGIVPRVRSDNNFRIPDLAVTCSPYRQEEYALADPVLVVEILSPSNQPETWANVWAYTTIPSIQEILIVHSTAIRADVLRRDAEGNWPEKAAVIESGPVDLRSIDFAVELTALYRGTRLISPAT